MCRNCAFLYYDRPRCAAVDSKTDWRCGLWHHHKPKTHTALIPSGAPWANPPQQDAIDA